MTKPQSGFYFYSPMNNYLAYYGRHFTAGELSPTTELLCPAQFHVTALDINARNECVAYFKDDCPLLHDLHFMFDIQGLYEH